MSRFNLEARMLNAELMPNVWDVAERFVPYFRDGEPPIDRPEIVSQRCVGITASLYPDCPICKRDLNGCECDPDDYADAVWMQSQARKAGAA